MTASLLTRPVEPKTVLVVEDSPLKSIIDRIVVPALVDKFLAEHATPHAITAKRSA